MYPWLPTGRSSFSVFPVLSLPLAGNLRGSDGFSRLISCLVDEKMENKRVEVNVLD